jgi:hypothetical protein
MALAAAFVIALASLVSSLAAARAAAETVAQPPGVLCHSETLEGADVPAHQGSNGLCVDCCVGCLIQLAALPSPPAVEVSSPTVVGQRIALVVPIILSRASKAKSHRSRAPPTVA